MLHVPLSTPDRCDRRGVAAADEHHAVHAMLLFARNVAFPDAEIIPGYFTSNIMLVSGSYMLHQLRCMLRDREPDMRLPR